MRYVVEIWSEIDQRYNPLPDIYTSEVRAIGKMNKYLTGVAMEGWNTKGRVIVADIRNGGLVPA